MATTRERLEKAVHDLQAFADEVDQRTQTAEDSVKLLKLAEDVCTAKKAFDEDAKTKGTLDEAKAFLATLGAAPAGGDGASAPKLASHTVGGLPMQTRGKTFGELFTESEQYGEFRKRYGGRDGVIPASTKGIQSGTFHAGTKDLVTGASSTSAGAFVEPMRMPGVTDLEADREILLPQLLTQGQTDTDTIEYVRVTSKTYNAATVPEATSSGQPAIYNAPTAGELLAGGYKPESGMALEVISTTVKTMAHWMPMTKRAASDAGQVRTMVDAFLAIGLQLLLEDQVLKGSGSGENFQGILNSGILTVGSAGTDIDAIVDAIRTVRVIGKRRPSAIVMHPNDWYSNGFLLAKNADGNYLIGDPRASLEQLNNLWGLAVVVSEAMTENTALVGDFRFGVLWNREGMTISVSDSHLDFFTRNLLAILAEMRAGFGVLDSSAFCSVTAV